jgi:hypothetical protein
VIRHASVFALATALGLLTCSCSKDSSGGGAAVPDVPGKAPQTTGGGACAMPGEWGGTYPPGPYPFSGQPISLRFDANGTGESDSARAHANSFAWKVEGKELTFHGTDAAAKGGRFTCKPGELGKYALTFSADCATVSLALTSDPCHGRAITMNGMSIKRK